MENILLSDLFNGYNPQIKPVKNHSDDALVGVQLIPFLIRKVDEKLQTFSTSLWVGYYWRDENLQWNPNNYSGITGLRVNIDQIWIPGICIVNELTDQKCLNFDEKGMAFIMPDGYVFYNKPMESTIQCILDISAYPFDEQVCTYIFYPYSTVAHNFLYIEKETYIVLRYFQPNEEWEVKSTSKSFTIDASTPDWPVQTARLSIVLKRRPYYVIINVFVPIFILSILNLMTFLLPVESGEKMGMTLAIFLTFAVFVTLISDSMPKSSDNLSFFGNYVAGQLIISGITIVLETIVIKVYLKESAPPVETGNKDSLNKHQECKQHDPDRWKRFAEKLERYFFGFVIFVTFSAGLYLVLGFTVMRRTVTH
ncbi:acetylcholine receptor subunit beta-type unc-29-like [Ostrea edulis]|uniref:acetylcholine receptor subunit beta-type unc-29-like n=1 Tax=Ostrea edulis TaxID=37623 RepID=UPI002094BBB2|nr:acetylcholine receptor subunit beta-type unc-29-like [Ostrea edulis]